MEKSNKWIGNPVDGWTGRPKASMFYMQAESHQVAVLRFPRFRMMELGGIGIVGVVNGI